MTATPYERAVAVAERYGIRVQRWSELDQPIEVLDDPPDNALAAQMNGERVIYTLDALDRDAPMAYATILHEIAHFVMEHPKYGFGLWEDIGLFSLERAIAKRADNACRSAVYRWQDESYAGAFGNGRSMIGLYSRREKRELFRHCREVAIRVGVIDECDEPTWRYADWSRLGSDLVDLEQ